MTCNGYENIFKIAKTILFIKVIILTDTLTTVLLKNSIYKAIPKNSPMNIYPLISPLLNTNREYTTSKAEIVQNSTSSI